MSAQETKTSKVKKEDDKEVNEMQEQEQLVDWKSKLLPSEVKKDSFDNEFVTLAGLWRLVTLKGIKATRSQVITSPSTNNTNATIIFGITFNDGSYFEAVGHANESNCSEEYAKFVVTMAESRAKARACRDALNIQICSDEERSDDIDNGQPITQNQLTAIKVALGRKGLTQEMIMSKASRKVDRFEDLTRGEAVNLIHYLNKQPERPK